MIHILSAGRTTGILVDGNVHILKHSMSSYGLWVRGARHGYCCQDGCCDRGLRTDVEQVVEQAKALGAKLVVLRAGQRDYRLSKIAGVPVSDVSNHIGAINDELLVGRGWN